MEKRVSINSLPLKAQQQVAKQIADPEQREQVERYLNDTERARRRARKAKRTTQKQSRRNNRRKK